jgi:nucleoside phosphorylase
MSSRLAAAFSVVGLDHPVEKAATAEIRPRLATIASGEKLLRDPAVLAGLRGEMHGRIEAGEMEAAGIAEACRRAKVDFVTIRGISDFGDAKKADHAHLRASVGAAVVCADFLREGLALVVATGA